MEAAGSEGVGQGNGARLSPYLLIAYFALTVIGVFLETKYHRGNHYPSKSNEGKFSDFLPSFYQSHMMFGLTVKQFLVPLFYPWSILSPLVGFGFIQQTSFDDFCGHIP